MDGIQENVNVSKEMKPLWGSKTIVNEYGIMGEMHREMEKAGIKCEKKDKSGNQPGEIREYNHEKQYDKIMYRKLSALYSVLNQIKKKGTVVTADMITEDTYKTVKEKYGISTKDLKRLVNDAQQGRVPDFFITDRDIHIKDEDIDTAVKFEIKGVKDEEKAPTDEEKKQRLLNLMYDEYEVLKKEALNELLAATSEREKKEEAYNVAKSNEEEALKELKAATFEREEKEKEKAYNDALENETEKDLEDAKSNETEKERAYNAAKLKREEKENAYNVAKSNEEEKNNKYKEWDSEKEDVYQHSEEYKLNELMKDASKNFSEKYSAEWKESIEKSGGYTRNYVSVNMNKKTEEMAKISSGKFTKTLYYKVIQGSNQNMREAVTSLQELLEKKRKEAGKSIKSFQMITLSEGEIQEFGSTYGISKKDLLKLSTEIQSGKTRALEEALTTQAKEKWKKFINQYKGEVSLEEAEKLRNDAETDVEKKIYATNIEELKKSNSEQMTRKSEEVEQRTESKVKIPLVVRETRVHDRTKWNERTHKYEGDAKKVVADGTEAVEKSSSEEERKVAESHLVQVNKLYSGLKGMSLKKALKENKPIIPSNLDGQVLTAHYTVDSTKRWLFEQKIKDSLEKIPGKKKMVSISQLVTSLNEEMKYEDKEEELKAYCMSLSHEEKIRQDINGLAAVLRILHLWALESGLDSQSDLGGGLVLNQIAALVEALGKIYEDGGGKDFLIPGYRELGEDKKWKWIPGPIKVGAIDIIRQAMGQLQLLLKMDLQIVLPEQTEQKEQKEQTEASLEDKKEDKKEDKEINLKDYMESKSEDAEDIEKINLTELTKIMANAFQDNLDIRPIKGTLRLSDIKEWSKASAFTERIEAMKQELALVGEVHDDIMTFINNTPKLKDICNDKEEEKEESFFRNLREFSTESLLEIYPVFHQIYQKANAIHSRADSFQKSFIFQQLKGEEQVAFTKKHARMQEICNYFKKMRDELNYEYKMPHPETEG